MRIAEHSFLVAGGSSGLGAACARRLVQAGGYVTIADVRPPNEALRAELGARAQFVVADVTDEPPLRQAIAAAREAATLRGAVICAGVLAAERVLSRQGAASLDAFRRVVEINLVGTFNVVRLTAEALAKEAPCEEGERGVIVLTSSIAAFEGQIGQAAYAASKGGVASMTLPLARDLSRHAIRVMCIAPGVFATPMMESVPDELRGSLESQTLFPNRFGQPDEFAALVEQIVTNRALNGAVLRLDCGLRMPAR